METIQLDSILTELTSEQKVYLFNKLKALFFGGISKEITVCPCCNSNSFIKHGSYKGTQKFKCLTTSKIFTYRTNTVISGIYKLDKLTELVELMGTGRFPTLTEIQKIIGISRQTAFDWRTKILTAVYEDVELNSSIIEFDELSYNLSRKGRQGLDQRYSRKRGYTRVGDNKFLTKIFCSYSRSTKKLELYTSHMGKTSANHVANYLGMKKEVIVYSDSHKSYGKFYRDNNVQHETFKASDHVSHTNKQVHNQNINRISGNLGTFINDQLRGVSTKYIQGYMNWMAFLNNNKKEDQVGIKEVLTKNKVALEVFKQKEREFKYFLRNNRRTDYGYYNDRYYGAKL